jgi:thiol-disulfide isomerase/thioredoxin
MHRAERLALRPAPEWQTTRWFNTPEPLTLDGLRGRVVLVHAFQMLCPGCVMRGVPQAQRVHDTFKGANISVIGLHTVFEHHEAMQAHALEVFLTEYQVTFPVGIDTPDEATTPRTMAAYNMQGTPTTLLIDAAGRLRKHVFGVHDDLLLGADIATLLAEAEANAPGETQNGGGMKKQRPHTAEVPVGLPIQTRMSPVPSGQLPTVPILIMPGHMHSTSS